MDALYFPKLKNKYGPMASSLVMAAEEMGVDLVTQGDDLSPYEKIIIFKNTPVQIPFEGTIGWYMCDLRPPEALAHVSNLHTIFLCNQQHIHDYSNKYGCRVVYTPQCGDDRPMEPGVTLDTDILFIGNFDSAYHKNRGDIIKYLRRFCRVAVIRGEEYTLEQKYWYNTTPFNLAISMPVEGYTSNRLYNILASGGLCLTLYFPGIEDLFEHRKHLLWFKTPEEAVALVREYKDKPAERAKIAEAGHQEYLNNHTAKHRLKYILSNI